MNSFPKRGRYKLFLCLLVFLCYLHLRNVWGGSFYACLKLSRSVTVLLTPWTFVYECTYKPYPCEFFLIPGSCGYRRYLGSQRHQAASKTLLSWRWAGPSSVWMGVEIGTSHGDQVVYTEELFRIFLGPRLRIRDLCIPSALGRGDV